MKIERINENQIRCTLSSFDLSVRNLNLGELAYGSEKARNLFREMIQKASNEVGFDAEDIPLMVEAIPLSNESVMLVITKIEDPEELDTRFSKFAPSVHDEDEFAEDTDELMESFADGADEVLNMLRKMNGSNQSADTAKSGTQNFGSRTSKSTKETVPAKITSRLFSVSSLREVTRLAHVASSSYQDKNSLYKDDATGRYLLLLNPSATGIDNYNRVCSLISEYARAEKTAAATSAYLEEHYAPLIKDNALEVLSRI